MHGSISPAMNEPWKITLCGGLRVERPHSPQAHAAARERHNIFLRQEFTRHGGREIKETGDGFFVAFPTAGSALSCAVAGQKTLADEAWAQEITTP
jgi:class 3 adenylate cyclase